MNDATIVPTEIYIMPHGGLKHDACYKHQAWVKAGMRSTPKIFSNNVCLQVEESQRFDWHRSNEGQRHWLRWSHKKSSRHKSPHRFLSRDKSPNRLLSRKFELSHVLLKGY